MSDDKANLLDVAGDKYQYDPPPYYQPPAPQNQVTEPQPQVLRDHQGSIPPMENPPNDYLVASILACLFCCWPLGLVGIVKALDVRNAISAGDRQRAEKSSETAKNFTIAAIVTGIIMIGVNIALYFLFLRNAASDYPD